MEAHFFRLSISPSTTTTTTVPVLSAFPTSLNPCISKYPVLCRTKNTEDEVLAGLPKHFHDEEWQARQREKTKELELMRRREEEEEERIVDEYRGIGMRLKDFPEDEVVKAKKLVSIFIRSGEEIEEKIEGAAERGELNEIVLMVIWNRLDLARHDEEKDAIRSLDLLYRRVEMEILRRQATPAMRLLNDLLNLYDGFNDEEWLKACKDRMTDTFPQEDPFSVLVPAGFDIDKHNSPLRPAGRALKEDNVLLRVDFIREVDAFLREIRPQVNEASIDKAFQPEAIATRMKQQEKKRSIRNVEALLYLAVHLKW